MKQILVLSLLAFIFGGCAEEEKPKFTAKTIDYYRQNGEECLKRVEECEKAVSLATEEERLDCANAGQASGFVRMEMSESNPYKWN